MFPRIQKPGKAIVAISSPRQVGCVYGQKKLKEVDRWESTNL